WSGGKDSCFALMKAKAAGMTPAVLLNVMNESGKISRSHGIPEHILRAQAATARLPIHLISSSWQEYEQHFVTALIHLKEQYGLTDAVFGDIDLQAHRDWEEKVCTNAGLNAFLPLWLQDRRKLVFEMLDAGIQTMMVSCNSIMGPSFLGKTITPALVDELEALGIDACGENGEFHALVYSCPLFSSPLQVTVAEKMEHENYWFSELVLH
ncbi:MAG TPA: diphthine--ammonia ligase, partial [Chitinophagaceae bacterium]|nr:diphthine--ammonia ligase [Chitinophagaceae bacterium]